MTIKTRLAPRKLLQLSAGALAATSGVLTLGGTRRAFASARPSGYNALICLHLNGGNNSHNWVVPVSQPAYGVYATGRRSSPCLRTRCCRSKVRRPRGVTYGLHPSCPELQALFNAGTAAIVGNVGPLIQPATAVQALAGSVALPPQIFSHLNQLTEWQTGVPQSQAPYGWR
jgi:uncharacterized protein (DUF1501 family)